MRAPSKFSSVAALLVIGAIVAGFSVIGTPGEVRLRRLDRQRVDDLQLFSYAISDYYYGHKALPESLAVLISSEGYRNLNLNDEVSGKPYEYKASDNVSYELCADFGAETESGTVEARVLPYDPANPLYWNHGRGRHCFTLHIPTR